MRSVLVILLVLLFAPSLCTSQTTSLLANGGFENGTEGWLPSVGAYGGASGTWDAAKPRARVLSTLTHFGRSALLLDASKLVHEVDASSLPVAVQPDHAYRLAAFVRQLRGIDGYKVTIDWQTAAGRHIRYDNDWRGNDHPPVFTEHGGVFVAPPDAGRAVLILGVQKGAACVFDDISLVELGQTEPLGARARRDGDGQAEIAGSRQVPARGFGTWRVVYTCGASGLPIGGAIVLRRYPVSYDWSPPQGKRPRDAGYVTARGPRGAQFDVQTGPERAVVVRLQWPALLPGERVEIVLGDRSGGGPGMQVQRTARAGVRWIAGSDCTTAGEWRDLAAGRGGTLDIIPAKPAGARLLLPAVAEAGKPVAAVVRIVDAYDNPAATANTGLTVIRSGLRGAVTDRTQTVSSTSGETQVTLRWPRPGLYTAAAHVSGVPDRPQDRAWIVITPRLPAPDRIGTVSAARVAGDMAVLSNDRVALLLPRVPEGWGVGVLLARVQGTWRRVASLPAVGRVAFGRARGAASAGIPGGLFFAKTVRASTEGRTGLLRLQGALRPPVGAPLPFQAEYRLAPGNNQVAVRFRATTPRSLFLASLHSPIVYPGDGTTGAAKDGALFPGLEFLDRNELSSDDAGVAWHLRERWIPHPYKITVPLMTVGAAQAVVGLTWDPLQTWDGTHPVPLAQFASPNRIEHKPNHLLSLRIPGFGTGFKDNMPGGSPGQRIPTGTTLALRAAVFILPDTHDVADAVRWWMTTHALPPPRPPRTAARALQLSAKGYMDVTWITAAQGWFTAVGLKPGFADAIADRLIEIADTCGDAAVASSARAQAESAMRAAGGPQGVPLNLRIGDAEQAVTALRQAAYGWMAKQHPDGGWSFADIFSTEGARAGLARADDVELGTCVSALEPILNYAVATGDPRATAAGLRGLDYIARFNKPAGAESWEVPLVCPNLRAAALALRCNLRGWQLTGREEYMRWARRWAWAGAAFIYAWEAPGRAAMPGASISVMGTTYYESTWFGWAVQWVGLVYAETLQEFARYDRSFDWQRLVALITASALHQQKTERASCGHTGLFPDSYSLMKGEDAYEWCLAPTGIVNNVLGTMGYPWDMCVHAVQAGESRVHIAGVSAPVAAAWDGESERLTLTLAAAPGTTSQIVLFGLSDPARVTWAGRPLARLPDPGPESAGGLASVTNVSGWRPARREQAIVLRLTWTDRAQDLVVEGATRVPYHAPGSATRLQNGGFEEGTRGWALEAAARIEAARPRSGRSALRIDAPDPAREGQATAQPFGVEPGRRYRLRAWVCQFEGDGDYKVTIEWLGASGEHLAYANDWQGTDRPRDYREHGGVFLAPSQAYQARIILGCRGARCLFDDLSLEAE